MVVCDCQTKRCVIMAGVRWLFVLCLHINDHARRPWPDYANHCVRAGAVRLRRLGGLRVGPASIAAAVRWPAGTVDRLCAGALGWLPGRQYGPRPALVAGAAAGYSDGAQLHRLATRRT